MKATHQVLDLVYTPQEGQQCFEGTEEQCYDFIKDQGVAEFMYRVVPITYPIEKVDNLINSNQAYGHNGNFHEDRS